jgi:hypothetical protein
MKTLRVYGDSFLSNGRGWDGKSLTTLLGEKLNVSVINKAIAGCSTEYAFIQLAEDIQNNRINQNDIIIFNTTLPNRLNLIFQNQDRPETAALYLRESALFDFLNNSNNSSDHSWFQKNQIHINWYLANQDLKLKNLNFESYIHTIKGFAGTMPDTVFVVLHNLPFKFTIPISPTPKNFLHSDIELWKISNNEYIGDNVEYWDFVKNVGQDPRLNHLCVPNLEIMSSLLSESINCLDISNLSYKQFNQKFIDPIVSLDQYQYYVSSNYMYYHNDSIEKLKKL